MKKAKICLIATGGTIASVETPHGMAPLLRGEALRERVPQLAQYGDLDIIDLLRLDSSNIQPQHWQAIAQAVADNYQSYDGFVITHGTDTMAYTAAALHYMLENLYKPVIITGSQLSLTEEGSDAPANLQLAMLAAASGVPGVFLAFNHQLIAGYAAKKLYTESFAAFASVDVPVAATEANNQLSWNKTFISIERPTAAAKQQLQVHTGLNTKIALLEIFPGFNPQLLRQIADSGYHAVILKGYGAGNFPSAEAGGANLLAAIDYAIAKGVKIFGTTQCIYDGVHMERYQAGRCALEHGVISSGSATVEALVVQLMLGKI